MSDEKKILGYKYVRKSLEERRELVKRIILKSAEHERTRAGVSRRQADKHDSYATFLEHRSTEVDGYDDRAVDLIIADWLAILRCDEADDLELAARRAHRAEVRTLLTPMYVAVETPPKDGETP